MPPPLKLFTLSLMFPLALFGCHSTTQDGPPGYEVDINHIPNPTPHPLKQSRFANPTSYKIRGKRYYVLKTAKQYRKRGIASWYGTRFHGRKTATGETYDMLAMTAASKVLPIPSYVHVRNLENNRSIIVKVNDRGPFAHNRIIDLSYVAAKKLGYAKKGTALVEVRAISYQKRKIEPTRVANSAGSAHLYLQVGSFKSKYRALALKKRLRHYTQVKISTTRQIQSGKSYFRVRVGPFKNHHEPDHLKALCLQHHLGKASLIIL